MTHNDTKINNVLFDTVTDRAICVIDLDTVCLLYTSIRLLILDHAAVYRYDTMGTGLVYPRKNAAVSSRAKGRLHLVAIMQRIVHADNWACLLYTSRCV